MPFPGNRRFQSFPGRIDDDQDARFPRGGIGSAGNKLTDPEPPMELIVKDGVNIVASTESLRLDTGHVELVLVAAAVVERIEHFDARFCGDGLGNAETHGETFIVGLQGMIVTNPAPINLVKANLIYINFCAPKAG